MYHGKKRKEERKLFLPVESHLKNAEEIMGEGKGG